MQFVNKQDDLTFLLREIMQNRFQAFFEFAAKLGAGDKRAHVERKDALVAQTFRNFVVNDTLRESFNDCGLANARLADQHRIVFGSSLQDLDRAADFVVATDDRIELALLRTFGQIDGVLLERLAVLFRVGVLDLLAAPNPVDSGVKAGPSRASRPERLANPALVLDRGDEEQLAGNVGVTALIRIGSSGGISPDLSVRDIVIAAGASTDSNANRVRFGGFDFAAVADFGLTRLLVEVAEEREVAVRVGSVLSTDHFYHPQPELHALARRMGILAVEMEAAGLYAVAAEHGVRAAAILTVSDVVGSDEAMEAEAGEASLDEMIAIALDTAQRIE